MFISMLRWIKRYVYFNVEVDQAVCFFNVEVGQTVCLFQC